MRKPLKDEFGGGLKEFNYEDRDCFAGVYDRQRFLNSQERALIVLSSLKSIRAVGDEEVCGVRFRVGESIGILVACLRCNSV